MHEPTEPTHKAPKPRVEFIDDMVDSAATKAEYAAMFDDDYSVARAFLSLSDANAAFAREKLKVNPDDSVAKTLLEQQAKINETIHISDDTREVNDAGQELVRDFRQNTRDNLKEIVIDGDAERLVHVYGQEKGQRRLEHYRKLAKEAIDQAGNSTS